GHFTVLNSCGQITYQQHGAQSPPATVPTCTPLEPACPRTRDTHRALRIVRALDARKASPIFLVRGGPKGHAGLPLLEVFDPANDVSKRAIICWQDHPGQSLKHHAEGWVGSPLAATICRR